MTKDHVASSILFVLLGLGLTGCDAILEPEPVGQTVLDDAYTNVSGAISGINAAYVPLSSGGAYNRAIIEMGDLASDDLFWAQGVSLTNGFEVTPGLGPMGGLWNSHFGGIARSNTVLNRVKDIDFGEKAALKASIQGQAHFLRALYYFNLVRFFGDVPLFTSELESPQAAAVSRSSTEKVYAQIENDLKAASSQLPKKSELDGSKGFEDGRATSGAASALLAKVYLTQEKWSEAAQAAKDVIDSGEYTLFPNYGDNFQGKNENGLESVFEIQYSAARSGTGATHNFRFGSEEIVGGGGAGLQYIPTNDTLETGQRGANGNGIIQAFEPGDARRDAALSNYGLSSYFNPASGDPMTPLVNKYFVGPDPDHSTDVNYPVLRYAEVLLIRAEALNEMGQGAEAADLINQVRNRANLGALPEEVVSDQNALREAIWHERRIELSFESKRYFDLNRTGRLQEVLAMQGVEIEPAKITPHPITGKPQFLYPIPLVEMNNNANMTQNPGY